MEVANKKGGGFSRSKKTLEPRPSRTLLLFEAVLAALEERVRLTEAKKSSPSLIASSLTASFKNDENAQSAWLSCLQAQLEAVTQLHQRYNWVLGQRQNASAREVQLLFGNSDTSQLVAANLSGDRRRTMANTLQAIRAEMARLDDDLYSVEQRLETTVLGWLECGIHGLAGFARLSPGSLFRLTLKHSDQKWESRIVTGKHNKQFIENDTHRFQIVLDYSLGIKAEEERSFGHGGSGSGPSDSFLRSLVPRALLPRRLIGTVNFDILPLISALPQLLTISLNTSGSIKLHIIIKWLPPPPPPAPMANNSLSAGQLAFELRTQLALDDTRTLNSNPSSNSSGAATFAARSGRRAIKTGKGSRTVRQHKSMSLNPNDVGALLSQLAQDDGQDSSEVGLASDHSVVSSVSPIPSVIGSSSLATDRGHSSWSWFRNTSPRSETNDGETNSPFATSRSLQPPPGAGMDRIRALALHDLNSSAETPRDRSHSGDTKALPTIKEPPSTTASNPVEKFQPADLLTSENLLQSISSVLGELRGRFVEISQFEQAFISLRSYLILISNSEAPPLGKTKNLAVPGMPLRSASVRQSIRRRKNHQDLQINVEPSSGLHHETSMPQMALLKSSVSAAGSGNSVASTGWPELDAAISSHLCRSLEDLHRLATVSFLPMEVGNHARQTVLESLKCHSAAIRQVLKPLVAADPSDRPILATDITASMLPSADSNSLWSALSRSPSGLIALPSAILHAELTNRISAFRPRGPAATYGPSPAIVADRALAKITQYYGEYVNGSTSSSITKLASTSNVVTLCDFALFAGAHSHGIIAKLDEVNDEVKFCHCLEPAILRHTSALNDDSVYASVLQATRRTPTPVLAHALAGAAIGNNRNAIAAAFRSCPIEWSHSLVNCIGCVLVWMAGSDKQVRQEKEAVESRLAFVSLLELVAISSPNHGANAQLLQVVASILAHLTAHDSDDNVRRSARSAAISLGAVGLTILAKTDRSSNAFQGLGIDSLIYSTSEAEIVDEI